jgi:uncharacterized membrane protein YbhN (UPF0104 family)
VTKERILGIIKIIVVSLVVFFIINYIVKNYNKIEIDLQFNAFLVLSLMFLIIGKMLLAYGAQQSLALTGNFLPFIKMLWVYSLSQLAKYVPGSVWQFMGRGFEYKKEGVSNNNILVSLMTENMFLIWGSTGVALTFLNIGSTNILLRIDLMFFMVFSVIIVFFFKIKWLSKLKFLSAMKLYSFPMHRRIQLLGTYVFNWVVMGISYYFLLLSFGFNNIPLHVALGSFSAGWVVGFLAVFVPGGIGVREIVLIYFLLPYITEQNSFAISAFSRLSWVFIEVFLVVLLYLYKKIGLNREVVVREPNVD